MSKKLRWLLLLIVILSLVAAACGDDDDDDNGDNGGGEASLDQSIELNGLTVSYPDDWAARAEEDNSIIVANNQAIIDRVGESDDGPQAGEFGMVVMAQPLEEMGGMGGQEAFEMMVGFMAEEGAGDTEISDVSVGDNDGFRADVTPEDGSDGFMLGYEQDGALIIVMAVSAEGEMGDFEDTALKIAANIEYSAP
jgi:hypothetical protein